MTSTEKLCLQWNDFKENITSSFRSLREDGEFTDVTLACEDGQQVEAHKVVLSSSSPFFMELLKKTKHPHPFIYMRGLRSDDLVAIMDFLYCGEANVLQENLDAFLALAEELRLKGLTGGGADAERDPDKDVAQDRRVPVKEENSRKFTEPLSKPTFEDQSSKISFDTTVAVRNDKINVELQDLDEQIKSMITRSEVSLPAAQGKMASCNVCGKQAPYKNMQQHIEANHITGVSHACDICGKVSRSRNALSKHLSNFHRHQNILLQD